MPQHSSANRAPASHPRFSRRLALQAGSVGILGLGMNHLQALQAAPAAEGDRSGTAGGKARAVIYIFLSGGLGQHDSFDMKPDAPAEIRGEFKPISTNTPGLQICEHLPMIAQTVTCGHCVDRYRIPPTTTPRAITSC